MKYFLFLCSLLFSIGAIAQATYSAEEFAVFTRWKEYTVVNHRVDGTLKYGVIDQHNYFVLEPEYEQIKTFPGKANFLAFKTKGKWGMMGTNGKVFRKPYYSSMDFKFFPMIVKLEEKYGFIDEDGKEIVTPQYENAGYYSYTDAAETDRAGMLAHVKQNGKWGYIDLSGKLVVPYQYDQAQLFTSGRAAVKKGELWGFIDAKGNTAIPFEYNYTMGFREGLAAVKKADRWGFIDPNGETVLPFNYAYAEDFKKGEAIIGLPNGKYYVIDKTGKKLRETEIEEGL